MNAEAKTQAALYQALDAWFANEGLEVIQLGKLMPGRKWTGQYKGRTITVLCSRRTKTKYYGEDVSRMQYIGHELAIEMNTAMPTRLTVTSRGQVSVGGLDQFLLSMVGLKEYPQAGWAYEGLKVSVHDEAWAARYLSEPEVGEAITGLLNTTSDRTAAFLLTPRKANFRMRESLALITPDRVPVMLDYLIQLSERVDAQPEPALKAKENRIERLARENPIMLAAGFFGVFIGIGILFALLLVLVVVFNLASQFVLFVVFLVIAGFVYFKWLRK